MYIYIYVHEEVGKMYFIHNYVHTVCTCIPTVSTMYVHVYTCKKMLFIHVHVLMYTHVYIDLYYRLAGNLR